MAAVTICSDFGAPQNKVCHCFHCIPIYLPWSDGTRCHDLSFRHYQFFPLYSPISTSITTTISCLNYIARTFELVCLCSSLPLISSNFRFEMQIWSHHSPAKTHKWLLISIWINLNILNHQWSDFYFLLLQSLFQPSCTLSVSVHHVPSYQGLCTCSSVWNITYFFCLISSGYTSKLTPSLDLVQFLIIFSWMTCLSFFLMGRVSILWFLCDCTTNHPVDYKFCGPGPCPSMFIFSVYRVYWTW